MPASRISAISARVWFTPKRLFFADIKPHEARRSTGIDLDRLRFAFRG
ncbi:MAG: hypothetical protein ACI8Z5_000773 [Lentimonas sp.]|jgi:hypothetical protein